ncbi:MAG TPA: HAD-IG family 5'-nucleotidase [Holophaga sp.]|jgi:HAD superfamily 5'-nucleotidase-like hydrolase|nr:HAD-IG family 5'-nucleotidase [Holophaga sp.]
MPLKNLVPSLLPVPRFPAPPEETALPHSRKVFALKNIHFRQVKAVGFDMDYTLSHYRSPEIDELAFKKSSRLLVREKHYPAALLDRDFDPSFAIRGLILDGVRGNLLKLNSDRMVVRASHGSTPIDRLAIELAYGKRRLSTSAKGFRSIDTLFEIPESHLFAVLVDAVDAGLLPGKDYIQVFQDVRWAIDTAHRNGDMKAEILENREFFILRDPELPRALDRWKRAGKKLFVLSNSEWSFTEGVLSYLLDGQDPARPDWRDYFDLVVVSAMKPAFFEEARWPESLPGETCAFSGGNANWMEDQLGASGEEILYIGDHIYGDILRSKKEASWNTCLLIPELGANLQSLADHTEDLQDFLRAETQRRQAEQQVSLLQDKLERHRQHRHVLASRLSPEALQALDAEAAHLESEMAIILRKKAAADAFVHQVDQRLEAAFNARWGSIFREGYQQTRFADQIHQYASAYTGRIANLYFMDPDAALYAPVPTLPHERI